jgi:superfamily II DNA or RNA helicase
MDEQSVYDLFDKNVPYDLRLREALENDLIVPFHYYGIRDSLVSYSLMMSAAKEFAR